MSETGSRAFATYPSLRGASVVVTGGASGIGMEIVRAFAGQGSKVGFLDVDVEHGRALETELRTAGSEITFEPCDLRHGTWAGPRPRQQRRAR